MTDRLQILRRKQFAEYKKKQPINIAKHLNRVEHRICTPQTFKFYLINSSCNSSMIEGSSIDADTYYKLKEAGFTNKDIKEVDDIVKAYQFATNSPLTEANLLKAHKLISQHMPINKKYIGAYRDKAVNIWSNGEIIYTGADVDILTREMNKLFHDIKLLISRDLTLDEVFYYASFIHLVFVSIHPFADGNGRSARLLEKWFLSAKLGNVAWRIQSEKLYYKRKRSYYTRLNFRSNYKNKNYNNAIDFLIMLPMALNIK